MSTSPLPNPALPLLNPARMPRLLVVDDQPVNIQAIYQAFAADHQVLMATSGEQALALCLAKQPDLVLLDVVMPEMDGYEVCARLKADPATRDIPVIFVTAQDSESAEAIGLDLGAVDFISKPINPRIVRARVRTHLALKTQADQLRELAYVDGLTGVHNRRRFDEQLAMEWARAVRAGTSLAVMLIDVDHFKRYNDAYGHQSGDDCLRRIAGALAASIKRPGDLVARYGGEEFVCLLPDTQMPGALQLGRQLTQLVHRLHIEHVASDVAPVVTVSVGVCCKPEDTVGSAASLLREADAQLYIAKSRGRHQACGAELDSP